MKRIKIVYFTIFRASKVFCYEGAGVDKVLYISMTGTKHNMLAQASHANNLANVSTQGFKADFAQARSMPIYGGEGLPTRAYALTEKPGTDFSQGPLLQTGDDLDIAIQGEGFMAVQAADGSEAYTRVGSLFIDSIGVVRTGSGLPVLGNGGLISLPPSEKIEISQDGSISVRAKGQGPEGLAVIDRIKFVKDPESTLSKSVDGLFRVIGDPEGLPEDGSVQVISGFLEGSNVNAVSELTSLLSLSRQFEMQIKLITTAKEKSEQSSQLLKFGS